MKKDIKRFFIVLALFLIITCSDSSTEVDNFVYTTGVLNNRDEVILYNKINEMRFDSLLLDDNFNKAAKNRIEFIKKNLPISHNGVGETVIFLDSLGIISSAESLAYGFTQSENVVIAWNNSESHANVLYDYKWKYIGVAIGIGDEDNKIYCAIFGY